MLPYPKRSLFIWRHLPFILSILSFFVSVIVLSSFINPPTCADGWNSLSIGRQGACSWHGGVEVDPLEYFVLPLGGLIAYLIYIWTIRIPFIKRKYFEYENIFEDIRLEGKDRCKFCHGEIHEIYKKEKFTIYVCNKCGKQERIQNQCKKVKTTQE